MEYGKAVNGEIRWFKHIPISIVLVLQKKYTLRIYSEPENANFYGKNTK